MIVALLATIAAILFVIMLAVVWIHDLLVRWKNEWEKSKGRHV